MSLRTRKQDLNPHGGPERIEIERQETVESCSRSTLGQVELRAVQGKASSLVRLALTAVRKLVGTHVESRGQRSQRFFGGCAAAALDQ